MIPKVPNVFISHSHADIGFVGQLTRDLLAQGSNLSINMPHPEPGEYWVKVIADDIRKADSILVVLSENTTRSEWVRVEIAMALSQERKRIVPIYASKNPDVPFMLRSLQGIDLSDPEHYSSTINQLRDLLAKENPLPQTDIENEIHTRLFKVELETLVLEHERVTLARNAHLKTHLIAITCACIATITATAGVSFVFVDKVDGYALPIGGIIGAIAGIAIVTVGGFISKSLRNLSMSK